MAGGNEAEIRVGRKCGTMTGKGGKKRTLLLWGLIGVQVALIGVAALVWREDRGGESASLERLETGLPAGASLTIESGYEAALRRALAWADDATLFSVSMQVDWPTDAAAASGSEIPGNGWVIYTFASEKRGVGPEGKAATLSMLVDRMSGVVIDEREMGWTWRPGREAAVTTYPISSMVALFAAETTMGNGYRMGCPQFRHLSRVSIVPAMDGSNAYWLVTYEDQRAAGQPAFRVKVDAMSGEVERDDSVIKLGGCG
jgi:hypothetical protein